MALGQDRLQDVAVELRAVMSSGFAFGSRVSLRSRRVDLVNRIRVGLQGLRSDMASGALPSQASLTVVS